MAAARRAEIHRRLAEIQAQKEREEALLRQLEDEQSPTTPSQQPGLDSPDRRGGAGSSSSSSPTGDRAAPSSSAVSADAVRALALQSAATEITVYGATVKVGDRVNVTSNQLLYRKAEQSMPQRDTTKDFYLSEPAEVTTVFDMYHGKPAVQLAFADGARHIFFAECLDVGDSAERLAAKKAAKAGTSSGAAAGSDVTPSRAVRQITSAAALDGTGESTRVVSVREALSRNTAPKVKPAALPPQPSRHLAAPTTGGSKAARAGGRGSATEPEADDDEFPAVEPRALPEALPRRPRVLPKMAAGADDAGRNPEFLAELNLLADAASDVSGGTPLTPGPGRDLPGAKQRHADPQSGASVGRAGGAVASRGGTTTSRGRGATTASGGALTSRSAATRVPAVSRPGSGPAAPKRPVAPTTTAKAAPAAGTAAARRAAPVAASNNPSSAAASPARASERSTVAPRAVPTASTSAAGRPVTVRVYENGNYGDKVNDRVPYTTVTVRPNFKTMASVHTLVSGSLKWQALGRKVETLYDARTGEAVSDVATLSAEAPLVASMGDAFIRPRPNSQLFDDLPEEAQQKFAAAVAAPATSRSKAAAKSVSGGTRTTTPGARTGATPRPAAAVASAAPRVAGVAKSTARTAAPTSTQGASGRAPARATPGKRATADSLLTEIATLEGKLEAV